MEMKISGVIITFNEEQNIQKCIESLLAVTDEIVVVDSFSTDKTEAICISYDKVSFIKNEFQGHIQQKNYAMEKAQFDFVLSLDADEALSESLQEELLALKKSAGQQKAYSMPRLNNYCGQWIKHSGWYPDRKIRLWDRKIGKWGGVNPHDTVVLEEGIKAYPLKGDLLHYTTSSITTHLNQVNKFSDIAAQQLLQRAKKPHAFFKMILDPPFMFFKKYIFQFGFLDGFYGFTIAVISAHAKFLKYAKYIQKSRNLKKS